MSNENGLTCTGQSISAEELLLVIQNGSPSFKATMYLPLPLMIIIILIYFDLLIFHIRNSTNRERTFYTIWVITVFPVLGCSAVAGLYTPRAAAVIAFGRNLYFAIALKKFFFLILHYYGGKKKVEEALKADSVVPQNYFPCCFVCCCRNQPMTVSRLQKLQITVYQVIFVYPIGYFIMIVFAVEGLLNRSVAAGVITFIIQVIVTCSGLTCLYGFTILGKSSFYALQNFFIRGKSLSITLLVACNTLQNLIIQFVDVIDRLPCGFPYADPANYRLQQNFILFYEVFLLTILGWYSFRRSDEDCNVLIKPLPYINCTSIPIGNTSSDPTSTEKIPAENGNGCDTDVEKYQKGFLPEEISNV